MSRSVLLSCKVEHLCDVYNHFDVVSVLAVDLFARPPIVLSNGQICFVCLLVRLEFKEAKHDDNKWMWLTASSVVC